MFFEITTNVDEERKIVGIDENGNLHYNYTPKKEGKKTIHSKIFTQELRDLDLIEVIKVINGRVGRVK